MWPDYVLLPFQIALAQPRPSTFHGPYNKLLYTFFLPHGEFVVVPKPLEPAWTNAVDVSFEIYLGKKLIFILELRDPAAITYITTRSKADDHLRERIGDLASTCPLPTLHAVSALGPKLSFYSLNMEDPNATITPAAIPRDPCKVNDYAPAERWTADILDEETEARLRSIFDEIQQGCAKLG